MNDVINRKDAIGAILSVGHIAELSDGDAAIRVSAVNYVLRNLPFAEPEIIYCKDCVHNKSKADAGNALCELYYGMTDQMGYCHKGERGDAMNEVQ